MCTKKAPSKKVSEDEERQVKAQKQLFQVLINLYPWRLIDSGLYQRIRQHYNNSSQSEYSTRLKVSNLIKRYSQVVHIKKTMRCVLALSMGWLVLKGYWNAHTKRLTIKFFHAHHAIKIENYGRAVLHLLTHIFVSALHHFCKLKYFDLEELQFVSGRGDSRTFFPIHDLTNDLDADFVEVLPTVHALVGCDTASKVGTKCRAVREGADCDHLLHVFGRDALCDEMIADAEKFFLKCITKRDVDTFDELRFIVYHKKYLEFDIDAFRQHLITSDSIYCAHIFSVIYGYTPLFWKTLTWIHLNMVIA